MTEKMNALRNKKGFTLIEMLVVIAIIAVLVAIVIPVVGSSTDKAAAAANAANLRSLKAEVTTLFLSGAPESNEIDGANVTITVDPATGKATKVDVKDSAPKSQAVGGVKKDTKATITPQANGDFLCYYGDAANTIQAFADVADGSKGTETIVGGK